MEGHSQTRFSDTPPDSPKSCMKGSRRLNFEDEASGTSSSSGRVGISEDQDTHRSSREESPRSSKQRSPRTVMIKSPVSGKPTTTTGTSTSSQSHHHHHSKVSQGTGTSSDAASDVQFQFQLTQHYDNPPPPPNCTSNGTYEDERKQGQSSSAAESATTQKEQDSATEGTTDRSQLDPQLVEIASKFVNEILEKAKHEVASRNKPADVKRGSATTSERDFFGGRTPWYRRAHGVVSKWVTNLCVRAQHAMRN